MKSPKTATYLYCVVESARAPRLARVPDGMPGAGRPRACALSKRLWLIAADAPLALYGAEAIERGLKDLDWVSRAAVAHEAVVEHLARAAGTDAVVPMKIFTLFSSDERAQAHILARRKKLERVLLRVRGSAEWGVRLRLDEVRARRAARQEALTDTADAGSGTRFLMLKKKQHEAVALAVRRAGRDVGEIYDILARLARDARQLAIPEGEPGIRVFLDAAFLVPAASTARFKRAVKTMAARYGDLGYELILHGPWPPYNFIS